jgi:uncharacterized cupin superfamily protein
MTDTQPKLVTISTGALVDPVISKPSRPIEGDTVYHVKTMFEAQGGKVSSGIWQSSAGKFRSDTTGYIEFGHILEGECRIVDPDGTVHHLRVGDPFIMPEGYKGHWEVDNFVKKVWFITETR